MDDANPKSLPPSERFRKLCDELAEGCFSDEAPLSAQERQEAVEFRTKIVDFARAYSAWLEAEKRLWGEKEKSERGGPEEELRR